MKPFKQEGFNGLFYANINIGKECFDAVRDDWDDGSDGAGLNK
jgi:hypothetical protein